MNKSQRVFVIVVMALLALGLHLWFCQWGWRRGEGDGAVFAIYTIDRTHDYKYAVTRGGRTERGFTYEDAKAIIDAQQAERRANPTEESREFERDFPLLSRSLRDVDFEPMPIDESGNLMTTFERQSTLGIWRRAKLSRDDAMLYGVFGPLAVIAILVFLLLGQPQKSKRASAPHEVDG